MIIHTYSNLFVQFRSIIAYISINQMIVINHFRPLIFNAQTSVFIVTGVFNSKLEIP